MQGDGRIVFENDEILEVSVVDGCFHGVARRLRKNGDVKCIFNYQFGHPSGQAWYFKSDGGILTGMWNYTTERFL